MFHFLMARFSVLISRERNSRTFTRSVNRWGKLLTSMIKTLLQTDSDYVYTFLRIIAGISSFPMACKSSSDGLAPEDLASQESRPLLNRSQRGRFLNLLPGSLSSGSRSEVLLLCPDL